MADYDAVVIGSGAGGLTVALALAQAGRRVLVLEQHYLPGGWCHSFDLDAPKDGPVAGKRFKFSPGVHYIGDLQPGGRMRAIYEGLGVANDMVFHELNPDGFDHLQIGQERFDVPRGQEAWRARLHQRFPAERAGIDRYVNGIAAMNAEISGGVRTQTLWDAAKVPLKLKTTLRHGMFSLERFIAHCGISDPLLIAFLTMQAGDHGMPASRCPAVMHAGVQGHYFNGGYYPRGGARAIPRAFIRALKAAGGELRTRAEVSRILLEGRQVRGVRLVDGSDISADVVVSNADPGVTFQRLLEPQQVPRRIKLRLARTSYSLSAISLFMAVDMDVKAAGLDSGNLWYGPNTDIEATYRLATSPDLATTELPGIFLTCTTLKDPQSRSDGLHTMESFCFVSHKAFDRWRATEFGQRPEGYEAFKADLSRRMLALLDQAVPGISERVVFQELGTPLTNRHYVMATEGNLYGIEKRWDQVGPFGFPIDTPGLRGLYCCGASTSGHGVAGATYSGLQAAKAILGCRTRDLLRATQQEVRIVPADHPESWPENAQA